MAVMNINDIVQVTITQIMSENVILNTLHYVCVTSDVLGTYEDIMTAIKTSIYDTVPGSWGAAMLAMQSNQVLHTTCRVQRIKPIRSVGVVVLVGLNGGINNPADNNNTAISVTKRTALAGRPYVGRMQIGGLPKVDMQAGEWSNGAKVAAQNVGTAMGSQITAGLTLAQFKPCLFHRTIFPNFTLITSTEAQATIRTMHRRTLRLGI